MEKKSKPVHILYMEDDPGLARLVQKQLQRAGYHTDIASDGKTGLEMYQDGNYDVIAVDQNMPGKSGLEVIRVLASRGPLPPIVMITGQGNELIAVEAMKLGAGDYIVKDVEGKYFETLPGIIERLLERQRLIEEKKQAEEALQKARDELEIRVEKRTAELDKANEKLRSEIAERKQVEEAFRKSERYYRRILDYVPSVIYAKDLQGNYTMINKQFEELSELTASKVLGRTDLELFPESGELTTINDKRVIKNLLPMELEEFGPVHGEMHIFSSLKAPLINQNGEVYGICGISIDITERKQVEEALRESDKRYRTLFEDTLNPILVANDKEEYIDANNAALCFLETSRDQLLGKSVWEYTPDDVLEKQEQEHAQFLKPRTLDTEYQISGKRKTLLLNIIPVETRQGTILYGIGQDITERKRAEMARQVEFNRLRIIMETNPAGIYIVDQQYNIEYINPVIRKEFGQVEGQKCFKYFHDRTEVCPWCKNKEVFEGKSVRWEWYSPKNEKYYDLFDTPIKNLDGSISKFEIFHDITERRMAEIALESSEERYRSLIEATTSIIWTTDESGRFVVPQPSWEKFTGQPWSEHKDFGWAKKIHPDDIDHVLKAWDKACREMSNYETWGRVWKTNLKEWRDFEVNAVPLMKPDGSLREWVGIITDITERKQAEEHIKRQATLLNLIFQHSLDSIVLLDKDYNFIRVSETYAKACQRDSSEFPGHNHFEFYPSNFKDEADQAKKGKYIYQKSARPFIFPDHPEWGTTYWDLGLVPILDKEGEIELFLFTLKDVTESEKAELMLRESEERFRTVADFTYDWEYWVDPDRNFVYVSPSCERITGYRADEFIRNPDLLKSIMHPDDWRMFDGHEHKTTKAGTILPINFRIVTRDGAERWIGHVCQSIYSDDGSFLGKRASNRDITENKQAEEKIQELNQSLEEMVYVTSHDLQVPLISMEGYTSELLDSYKEFLDEEGVYCLTRLQANAQRMHTLVLSLLDMSRLNTKINPPTVFEAREVIDHAIWDSELLIQKSKTKIELKNVPRIFGDKLRIITVFRNLITNAIIYGGDKITIGYQDKNFYIQDNGIGIPKNQLEKIFSPTERLKMVDVEGVGMGLAFCKKVIRQHGGEIWAESEGMNKGATFYFMLKPEKQDKG
ncbi:PAS domain S-box protein [Desulfococcaceae bacterium HSG9]|nr:PAS domain S-box protein [Desulfococcaceae bacterium HSG9]